MSEQMTATTSALLNTMQPLFIRVESRLINISNIDEVSFIAGSNCWVVRCSGQQHRATAGQLADARILSDWVS